MIIRSDHVFVSLYIKQISTCHPIASVSTSTEKKSSSIVEMSFNEKVVLITGAGSGIGAETAKHFAKLGGKLAIVDIKGENLDKVASDILANGSKFPALKIVADVSKDAERIISETVGHFGKLDVLINNVGVAAADCLMSVKTDVFDRIMLVNVRSTVFLTQLAVQHLKSTKGNVVNVSSLLGTIPHPELLTYSMSKAAITQFTKSIAIELGPLGIRVNAVAPGIINTTLLQMLPAERWRSMLTNIQTTYPVRRIGETNDIASAISFLADNEAAAFVTGSILSVDGGAGAANIV